MKPPACLLASLLLVTFFAACGSGNGGEDHDGDLPSNGFGPQHVEMQSPMISMNSVAANSVTVSYILPQAHEALFQQFKMVAWSVSRAGDEAMVADFDLPARQSSGETTFFGLSPSTADYRFGLVSRAGVNARVATGFLPNGSVNDASYQSAQINVAFTDSTEVAFHYVLPAGSTPAAFGYRVGLQKSRGRIFPGRLEALSDLPSNGESGTVMLRNLSLQRATHYTAAILIPIAPESIEYDVAAYVTFIL